MWLKNIQTAADLQKDRKNAANCSSFLAGIGNCPVIEGKGGVALCGTTAHCGFSIRTFLFHNFPAAALGETAS